MRYDVYDLYALRYPCSDALLENIITLAALPDMSGVIPSMLKKLSCDEIRITTVEDPDSIVEHCSMYHPDAIMLNIDVVSEDYIYAMTSQLTSNMKRMPTIICLTMSNKRRYLKYLEAYNGYYIISPPIDEWKYTENLKDYLMTKLISVDYLMDKVKDCCVHTLKAMRGNPLSEGFNIVIDCMMLILRNPYLPGDYFNKLIKTTARKTKLTAAQTQELAIDFIETSLSAMTPYEKHIAFEDVLIEGREPNYLDYLYVAARLSSRPCRKILRYIEDEPFFCKINSVIYA